MHHLRRDVIPQAIAGTGAKVYVGGFNALTDDFANLLGQRLPLFIAVVIILSFLLLMAVFRSILVPLKAAIMNLLSIGAAYGVIVMIFQCGWGKQLVGVGKEGPIQAFLPIMMFAILFGLSMDYEVFLLSRIREEYLRTGDNGQAVADGLSATARVITAAAAIMCTFFLSFVLGDNIIIKLFGIGFAERDLHRRHADPHGDRAVDDGAARRRQLVAARLARPASSPTSTSRARASSRGARRRRRCGPRRRTRRHDAGRGHPAMTERPAVVVIVGGGYGGVNAAKALDADTDVVLVEPKDAFVHSVASLRALVEPAFAPRIFLPYDRLLARGRVEHGRAIEVAPHRVVLASGREIAADYVVLASGSSYPFPAKSDLDDTQRRDRQVPRARTTGSSERAGCCS